MKAWIGQIANGTATYEIGDVPAPALREGEILVRVKATGLNRVDQRPKSSHFSHTEPAAAAIPGLEMAGEITEMAGPCGDFRIGDRVMAMVQGGAAEFSRVHHSLAMRVPDNMPWDSACAVPISYLTAYDAITMRGEFRKGDHLLIHAVTSGVGIASVQIGRLLGARSIGGSSSSARKLDRAREIGVTYGILDIHAAFADTVNKNTEGRGADVVVDNIGGTILNETIRSVTFGGRIIDVGRLGGATANIDLDLLAVRRASLIGVTFRTRTLQEHSEICRRFVADHGSDLATGQIQPVIARSFGFADLPAAIDCARGGSLFGKIVLVHERD